MEVEEKNESNSTFTKSSMSVLDLNNYIVSLRSTVKRAKLQVIQKLLRKVKMYKSKKGTEEQISANNKKAERFLEEIKSLKNVDIDKISKYSLGNKLTVNQASLSERVYARVACHKSVENKVLKWREEHDDWESLAAFSWSKITGRRFKKKKHDTDQNTPGTEADIVEVTKLKEFVGRATCIAGESNDCDKKVEEHNEEKEIVDDSIQEDRLSQRLLSKSDADVSRSLSDSSMTIDSDKQAKVKSAKSKKKAPEVIVKQITLDQLSDEELFLPPIDNNEDVDPEDCASIADNETRAEDDFFTAADDVETDESEGLISNTFRQVESDSEESASGKAKFVKRQNSAKDRNAYGSTSYQHRSGATKSYADRRNNFSNKDYTKGSSRFPPVRGDSYPKKFSSRGQGRDKFNRREAGQFGRPQPKSDWGNSRKSSLGARDDRYQNTYKPVPELSKKSKKPPADERLHPSWEASRRKKEQQKNVFSFQGTKKVFADD